MCISHIPFDFGVLGAKMFGWEGKRVPESLYGKGSGRADRVRVQFPRLHSGRGSDALEAGDRTEIGVSGVGKRRGTVRILPEDVIYFLPPPL